MPTIGAVRSSVRIKSVFRTSQVHRPMRASLGVHVVGYAYPQPDRYCDQTLLAGFSKRVGRSLPGPVFAAQIDFVHFVDSWICSNLEPIDASADVSVDGWLAATSYTIERKNQLRRAYQENMDNFRPGNRRRCNKIKAFIKAESYDSYKHSRGIYSRNDPYKVKTGPVFKLIEKEMFVKQKTSKYFIKSVPAADRARFIASRLGGSGLKTMATDYTAFESHFTESLLTLCEFRFYSYMTRNLPCHRGFMRDLKVLVGENHVCFKNVRCGVKATRMSGEMNTSLGNSFANLMMFFYIHRNNPFCDAIVEGDDCIGVYRGATPTNADYARLGLTVKIETPTCLSQASFCGQVFTDDFDVIADPHKIITKTGWIDASYMNSKDKKKKELLRCRAMSILSLYPACPIVTSYGLYLLRATAGYHYFIDRSLSLHEMEHLRKLCENFSLKAREPSMACRRLMEATFNFSVIEQIYLEKYFDGLTHIQPIDHPLLFSHASKSQLDYYLQYCFDTPQPTLGGQINHIYVTTKENRKICESTSTSGPANERSPPCETRRKESETKPPKIFGGGGRECVGRPARSCDRRSGGSVDIPLDGFRRLQDRVEHHLNGPNSAQFPTDGRRGRNLPP
jgi:hypothetical protein